jgi:hypothetical protein
LVLNSGKSFLTNMVLTPQVPITEIQISNLKESMSTIMKLLVDVMYPEQSLWT